jgi:hypothetical protein
MGTARRDLTFATLDDAARDAEHLLAVGYERAGNWDLAQVCGHLTEWLRYPLDGYPKAPLVICPLLWLAKVTVGRSMRDEILRTGKFRSGGRTMPETVPQPGGDSAAAVARFQETAARFQAHAGGFDPSPLFGQMTRDEWLRLNLAHCAHHLSFLVPKP